jgi:hypothetical protein
MRVYSKDIWRAQEKGVPEKHRHAPKINKNYDIGHFMLTKGGKLEK